jgi:solute carrier family 25 carnitine/acylcarnitine transporter 20/29
VIDCGVRTVRAQGFMGIYRGMGITLLRDTPSYFAYFGTFVLFTVHTYLYINILYE